MASNTAQEINDYFKTFLTNYKDSEDILNDWDTEVNLKVIENFIKDIISKKGKKKLKDPNAPKRGKNGYIFFCGYMRTKVKEEMQNMSDEVVQPKDITRELGKRWKTLKESKKKKDKELYEKCQKESENDKKRYNEEMKEYVPPSDEELEAMATAKKEKKKTEKPKKEKKTEKPKKAEKPKIKRGRSAWIIFSQEFRPQVKQEMGEGVQGSEVTKRLGQMWSDFKIKNPDKYQEYQQMALDEKKKKETQVPVDSDNEETQVPVDSDEEILYSDEEETDYED